MGEGWGEQAAANLQLYLSTLRHAATSLTGDDIIALGVPQGPQVGHLLRQLLDARLDGSVTSKQQEQELAARLARCARSAEFFL